MPRPFFILPVLLFLAACQPADKPPLAESAETLGNQQAMMTKADVARSLGRSDEALELYRQAAEASTGSVRPHLEAADIYRSRSEYDAALEVLEAAYKLNPASGEVLKSYAQMLLLTGQDGKALDMANAGIEANPHDLRLLNIRGVALDRAGRHQEAQAAHRAALEQATAPRDREYTTNNLALSLVASGDSRQAVQLLEAQLPKAQNRTAIRQLLAMAHGASGHADKAYELGLMDLSLEQVQENLKFYEQLRAGTADTRLLFMPAKGQ